MLIVRDAQGLRDKAQAISNTLREIATDMFQGKVPETEVRGLLMIAATELDSTIDEYVEVESGKI